LTKSPKKSNDAIDFEPEKFDRETHRGVDVPQLRV